MKYSGKAVPRLASRFKRRSLSKLSRSDVFDYLDFFLSDLLHPAIHDQSSKSRSRFCLLPRFDTQYSLDPRPNIYRLARSTA